MLHMARRYMRILQCYPILLFYPSGRVMDQSLIAEVESWLARALSLFRRCQAVDDRLLSGTALLNDGFRRTSMRTIGLEVVGSAMKTRRRATRLPTRLTVYPALRPSAPGQKVQTERCPNWTVEQ